MSHESTRQDVVFPRWLADFKEAGDGKSNADMSKIRPLRQKIWPLGTKVVCDWKLDWANLSIDISGMCSEKRNMAT